MPDILQPGFNPGGHQDRVDNRDYLWSDIATALPPFDWNAGFDIEQKLALKLPTKNQNGSGSCGGQAMSQYMGVKEAVATTTFEERSAKFIYSQAYVPGGGSAGRTLCDIVIKQGSAREALLLSYDNGMPPSEAFMERSQDITLAARNDAKLASALSYALVNLDIDSFAQAIASNDGMMVGLCGQNNGTWKTQFPTPPTATEWRHWMYFGKAVLLNGKKYIAGKQSWGPGVGLDGWQYFGEEWFTTSNVFSGWTLVFNNQSPTPPFSHYFQADIKLGAKGDDVVALQRALQIDGEFTYPSITGFYGDVTRKAVVAFQAKYGIPNSRTNGSIVGPKTRAKLNELFSK